MASCRAFRPRVVDLQYLMHEVIQQVRSEYTLGTQPTVTHHGKRERFRRGYAATATNAAAAALCGLQHAPGETRGLRKTFVGLGLAQPTATTPAEQSAILRDRQ